jgi:hypothetical protein
MHDLDDILIERPDRHPFAFRGRRRQSPGLAGAVTIVLVMLVTAAGIGWYLLRNNQAPVVPGTSATTTTSDPATALTPPAPPAAEPLDLPALDASDNLMRELVTRLSSHPQLAAWLVNDDLVRRFVATVVDLSRGVSPAPHVRFLTPAEKLQVREAGGGLVIDPASYRRYDLLTATFVSLDGEGTARLYRQLEPLFDEAYQELGLASGTFGDAFAQAIENLLAVEVPDRPLAVTPGDHGYDFDDPRIEARAAAGKHLLRMGPENARRIQAKLHELADALGMKTARG